MEKEKLSDYVHVQLNWLYRNMSSYSVGVDQSRPMSHIVQWWEVYGMGAEMWTLHLPSMCLLCHWQMKHLWGRRWAEGLTVTPSRKSVHMWLCVSVCVKKSWGFYPGGLGQSMHFPPCVQFRFWATNHRLFFS